MTKSKTDKHLTLSYLKGIGNGKINVFKELTPHSRTF